ncbi:MAG: hypothetical protein GY949_09985, partial [Gammaproteobacteria bacterium]|nr:hypothetical protein [Gammaproteobacteria bacterium]
DDVDYLPSGYYVVEAATPPGYIATATKDKNVDFGDTFTINPLALPPICVGEPDVIGATDVLNLFPGADIAAPFQGTTRRMCNRKLVQITDGKNMAADFFLHTETPVAGQFKGFAINDLANEFDFQNPNAGEKWAPPNIPVSIRDHVGNEVYRTTTDKFGQYNVVVPSSFRINTPMASGVSANMAELCLNAPFMENPYFDPDAGASETNPRLIPDPFFNKQFSQFCWTFNSHAGLTTYLDTPLFAISAFSGPNNWQLDCEYPTETPVIHSVSVANGSIGGGPYVPFGMTDAVITIASEGPTQVADPNGARVEGENTTFITRDFGFGAWGPDSSVTINGVELDFEPEDWVDSGITATIPAGVTTGQLVVTRDNGVSTVVGVSVIIDDGSIPAVNVVGPTGFETIQEAIDMTPDNGVVLVSPGQYQEGLFVTKPIQLQGWGPNV